MTNLTTSDPRSPRSRRSVARADRLSAMFAVALLIGCGRADDPDRRESPPVPAAAGPEVVEAAPATPERGKWRRHPGAGAAGRQPAAGAVDPSRLQALPYLAGYRAAQDKPLISRHDPRRAWAGLNLATSGHAAEAVLFDMEGAVLHRWRMPIERAFPALRGDESAAKVDFWRRVHLLPDGALLGIYDGRGLVKLDRSSGIVWARLGGFHHQAAIAPDGAIVVLDRVGRRIPRVDPDGPVLEDLITVLEPDGSPRAQLSVLEAFERSDYASLLLRRPKDPDFLHTNTLHLLDGRDADRLPALAAGNWLVSVLELDTVAIIDPRQGKVVWALAGLWRRQHEPTILPGPRLLVFDNVLSRQSSRVLEIDPLTQEVVWRFPAAGSEETLFSRTLGTAARLPNGNTLITESEGGRALEVTGEGEVVWEYYNPQRVPDPEGRGELVASLFEVTRLAASDVPWLPAAGRR